jgi:hypothetical protein
VSVRRRTGGSGERGQPGDGTGAASSPSSSGSATGHYCDVATRTCKKQLAVGAACTPQTLGVEDEPCSLATCDAKSRRCAADCK